MTHQWRITDVNKYSHWYQVIIIFVLYVFCDNAPCAIYTVYINPLAYTGFLHWFVIKIWSLFKFDLTQLWNIHCADEKSKRTLVWQQWLQLGLVVSLESTSTTVRRKFPPILLTGEDIGGMSCINSFLEVILQQLHELKPFYAGFNLMFGGHCSASMMFSACSVAYFVVDSWAEMFARCLQAFSYYLEVPLYHIEDYLLCLWRYLG